MNGTAATQIRGTDTAPVMIGRVGWLDEASRRDIIPGRLSFSFPGPVRAVLRRSWALQPSLWSERHRSVHKSSMPGPWRNEVTPHLVGIMDASMYPSVRKIIGCKAPQTGVTEAVINCICSLVDQDPADVIFLYPNKEMGRENIEDRIIPALRSSKRLRRYLTGNPDDISKSRIKLLPMTIYTAWAHSPASMANRPAKYVVIEEPDKYPEVSSRRETSPERLIEARTTTYPDDHKIWMFSSPSVESGPIWQALITEAQVIFEYAAVCPYCAGEQVMLFAQIKKPDGEKDAERVESEKLAWYECEHCREHWNDVTRNRAIAAGRWLAKGDGRELFDYLRAENPGKIGFHLPSWISRFVSLSKVMASFMRGLSSRKDLKDFRNKHAAEPWLEYVRERKEDAILTLRDDRPRGIVPGLGQTAGLVAFADTQDDRFYYVILAVGYGLTPDTHLVADGEVLSLDDLAEVLWQKQYRDAADQVYPVQQALIDSAGHRTGEVYAFCAANRGRAILPARGERTMAQPFTYSKLEFYPGSEKRIPGGLMLVRINTLFYKDECDRRLGVNPADPGGIHLHAETSEEFARQLCAEALDENGFWQQIGNRANHYWDCLVGCLVAADIRGIRYWPRPGEYSRPARKMYSEGLKK